MTLFVDDHRNKQCGLIWDQLRFSRRSVKAQVGAVALTSLSVHKIFSLRSCAGVTPISRLNVVVIWLCEENPVA